MQNINNNAPNSLFYHRHWQIKPNNEVSSEIINEAVSLFQPSGLKNPHNNYKNTIENSTFIKIKNWLNLKDGETLNMEIAHLINYHIYFRNKYNIEDIEDRKELILWFNSYLNNNLAPTTMSMQFINWSIP